MRKMALNMVCELARSDERIVFIGSDLGVGTLDEFKRDMPSRFFMEGIAEANLIGMAAGLAMEGHIVYVNTIASFLTRRCFEQIALDICLAGLSVRLIGNGGGCVYAPLGPTHLATDDIALMRALPNMTIVAPADAEEMQRFMTKSVDHPGPIYIRLAKGYDPIVTHDDEFTIAKAYPMRKGLDALIVTTGVTLQVALAAADNLAADGIETTILHMPTIKPLDKEAVLKFASQVKVVVTLEEHSIIGGLGSAIAETLSEDASHLALPLKRMGFPDVFPHGYGSQAQMMARYDLSPSGAAGAVKQLLEKRECK